MKTFIKILLIFIFCCFQYLQAQKKGEKLVKITILKGPYLGQKPPGNSPKVFAPGFISTKDHKEFACSFSPDMKEFFFNRGGTIFVSKRVNDEWRLPVQASFNSGKMDHEPHITADGKRLFFGSNRKNYGIWMTEKGANGWGPPSLVGSGMFVTTSRSGDIFVTSFERKDGSLVCTKLVNGKFADFEYLKGGVDSPYNDWHPCIAPDGSYIIFDSNRPGSHQGEGTYDLYVSFKNPGGTWSEAKNVGERLEIKADNICANISPDGKYLFYNSENLGSWDIFWVSTKVIEALR
jgi:hypothetical protein